VEWYLKSGVRGSPSFELLSCSIVGCIPKSGEEIEKCDSSEEKRKEHSREKSIIIGSIAHELCRFTSK
jgi:hypothetical protein